jgi:hypothetical protein
MESNDSLQIIERSKEGGLKLISTSQVNQKSKIKIIEM